MHPRAIGIEYARHFYPDLMLAVIVEEEGLCATLALVISGTDTDGVHVSPVALRLGMDGRIAVDLGSRCL